MASQNNDAWWRGNSAYQWMVIVIAGGAWLFDNFDQRLFSLARIPALADLMEMPAGHVEVQAFGKVVTAVFLVGWGLGGMYFGAAGDRFGRVRMLAISILIYTLGTGATALAQTADQFLVLRSIAGFGIGGVFGLAVATVAENFTGTRRVAMLALLQVLSVVGNIGAALTKMGVDGMAASGSITPESTWRWIFALGTVPIILAVGCLWLRESESWTTSRDEGRLPASVLGSYGLLMRNRAERRNLVIGALLALSGVVGLWAIGEYATDLQEAVFASHFAAIVPADEVKRHVADAKNLAYLLQMIGAAVGMLLFTWAANRFGRRPAFIGGFLAAGLTTVFTYALMKTPADAYWMVPLMGAAQLSVFAGFSIYLPELFGVRVRATGVSFCYNLGRFAAAAGSFISATLAMRVYGDFPAEQALRYSAITMCIVFVIGLAAAIAAPETKGKELSE